VSRTQLANFKGQGGRSSIAWTSLDVPAKPPIRRLLEYGCAGSEARLIRARLLKQEGINLLEERN